MIGAKRLLRRPSTSDTHHLSHFVQQIQISSHPFHTSTTQHRGPPARLRFGGKPLSLDHFEKERQRQNRIANTLLEASKLGPTPSKRGPKSSNPLGTSPWAGWQPTPGSSSRATLGRPVISPKAYDAMIKSRDVDLDQLLGGHSSKVLSEPIEQGSLLADEFIYPPKKVTPGTFVELRNSNAPNYGIVLPHPEKEPQTSTSGKNPPKVDESAVFVLVSSGYVAAFLETEVMFQIPGLIEEELAYRATPISAKYVQHSKNSEGSSSQDGKGNHVVNSGEEIVVDAEPVDVARFEARASILTRLRILEKQKEKEIQRLLPTFRYLFLSQSAAQEAPNLDRIDLLTGTITPYETATLMSDFLAQQQQPQPPQQSQSQRQQQQQPTQKKSKQPKPPPLTVASILAAHMMLMNHPAYFKADALSHRNSQLFTCRDARDRYTLDLVTSWAEAPAGSEGDKYIHDFCEKAKTIRSWLQANPLKTECQPAPASTQGPNIKWTSQDRQIIAFLRSSLGSRRELQVDTHGSISMNILKRASAHILVKPHPLGKSDLDLQEAERLLLFSSSETDPAVRQRERDILRDLAAEVYAGGDIQHSLVLRFLKEIGVLAPWHNPIRLDTTFHNLTSTVKNGEPEVEPERITVADLSNGQLQTTGTAKRTTFPHKFDNAIEDLRHDFGKDLPVYVIDDASAFELDDGVSIEKVPETDQYWVHAHIADPSASIRPGDELDSRASRRFSTLYFPEARWALLPDEFVNSGVGISPPLKNGNEQGQRVLTFSAKVDINTGLVDDFKIQPGFVHNVQIVSYDRVNKILADHDATTPASALPCRTKQDFQTLHRIAQILLKNRCQGTGFLANRPSPRIHVSPLPLPHPGSAYTLSSPIFLEGAPTITETWETNALNPSVQRSQFLVSEIMILAGRIAGAFGHVHDVPLPYRMQERPRDVNHMKVLAQIKNPNTGVIHYQDWIKTDVFLFAGGYNDSSAEHFSLGIANANQPYGIPSNLRDVLSDSGYVRSSSPLRRYPDLVTHWQIKSKLVQLHDPTVQTSLPFDRSAIRKRLRQFERQETLTNQLGKAAEKYWLHARISDVLHRCSNQDPVLLSDSERLILGSHEAVSMLGEVRAGSDTSTAKVRVLLPMFGFYADLIWGFDEPPPTKGDKFQVKIIHTVMTGLRSSVIVRRI